ncbi:uncharacterized protein LOC108092626 [Drosophila ficusphila]|uniref:uncharacterized protein LOC108092626 n=1 Tax=Drosophila ficusphila TaxID=30025 RepID=UPI0007E645A1|nr:uncharacterized protein LOC108092626 [Drosophila ficusphila]
MKLYLLLAAFAISWILIDGAARRTRNQNCLRHNKYPHERSCRGQRRVFYTFHRVIFDCAQVFTKCRKMYSRNEYPTLNACRDDCAYHMKEPVEDTTPADGGDSTVAAEGGGEGAE